MPILYAATLGVRPEAITVALDRLREQYSYAAIAVLHTDVSNPALTPAYNDLREVLRHDYKDIPARFREITYENETSLNDIDDQRSAEAYYRSVLRILYEYKVDGYTVHLNIAGGRKAMSIYATLAASVIFEEHDRVWTVLSPESMIAQPGKFHIPPGMRDQVVMVELPLRHARIAPGTDIEALMRPPISRAQAFIAKLTPAERDVADLLLRHPYASNDELGRMQQKQGKTIENQLWSIYGKMVGFLDGGEKITDKRQALRDLLRSGE